MKSAIADALELDFEPVAVQRTDSKPEGARQFKEKRWGCVMFMLAAAAKGETAAFDRNTFGCQGGGTGLGFGNQYHNFAGGIECFCYFLSCGNSRWEKGRQVSEGVKQYLRSESYDNFVNGERYLKSPEQVRGFIDALPIIDIPEKYVLFIPLNDIDPDQNQPDVVVFFGDMDQISAMTILANYHQNTNDNVIYPFAAGCQSIGIYAFAEAASKHPRAVLGLNDISARLTMKRALKKDLMSFAVPYALYQQMEENVEGSFVRRPTWQHLRAIK